MKFGWAKGVWTHAAGAGSDSARIGTRIRFPQNFSFALEEAGAISEGFDDDWAEQMTNIITPNPACGADWDSVADTSRVRHCLGRVDTNLDDPQDVPR